MVYIMHADRYTPPQPKPHNYVIDDRAWGYRLIGENICQLAESSCSLKLDTTTKERWCQLLGLLREVDTLADERSSSNDTAIASLQNYSIFAADYPALQPSELGDARFTTMVERTQEILHIGRAISQAGDKHTYIELRKAEAYYSAQLLADAATDAVTHQPTFGKFMHCITGFGIGANLVDSMLDAPYDYARQKSNLKPSVSLYASLGKDILRHTLPHMHRALHPTTLRGRRKAAYHRIVHRLTYGPSPDSSFKMISGQFTTEHLPPQ